MRTKFNINKLVFIALAMFLSLGVNASAEPAHDHNHEEVAHKEHDAHGEEEKDYDPVGFATHHVLDSYGYHLWGDVSIPLPIILYTDKGLVVFSSSEFHHDHHGHTVVEKNGMKFVNYHEKVYQLKEGETHLIEKDGELNAVRPLDFSITKNVATLFLVAILMLFIFFSVSKYYKKNGAIQPGGLASWLEPLIIFVRDDIAKKNIGHKYAKFMPYLLTVFFFILIGNILGLIPFLSNPNLTGNISVTLTLAAITLIIQLIFANKYFWSHIFMPPVPVLLWPILVPIEILGIFIKPGALMIRLFANITAGHIIVLSLIGIIFMNKSAAWSGLSIPMTLFISVLEILVAFLQAYIFTMLSALFIGTAVEEHH